MTYAIPDSRLEDGDLMVGRKPTESVKVDTEHVFGQYCVRAFVPNQGIALDLIDGILSESGDVHISPQDNAVFDGSGDKYTYSNSTPVSNELTILCKLKRTESVHNEGIYSDKGVAEWGESKGVSFSFRSAGDASLLFKVGSSETYTYNVTNISLGEFGIITAAWKASEYQKIYTNNIESSYISSSVSSSFTESPTSAMVGSYYNSADKRLFEGEIEYLYVLNKYLTYESQVEFHQDPYQFLIPA